MMDTNTAVTVPPSPETVRWLENTEALDTWLTGLAPELPLALDTEFERVSTFYPIPGLVQLGAGEELWLVEPDVVAASEPFRQLLADPRRPKLLYAMSEDLELFRHWLNVAPAGVLDLQLGAALAGAGFSVGYARLVESLFGETLDKSATRSDWLARPLTPEQQRYALEDIRFLAPLYQWVKERLQARGLEQALEEESARFAGDGADTEDFDQYYLKLRGGWTLSPEQQSVLQALVAWREGECRRLDRPRNRVLNDGLLIAVAERQPGSLAELKDVQGVPGGFVRRYGEQVLALIRDARKADFSRLEPIPGPLTREQQGIYRSAKKYIKKVAEDNDIPIEILAPRKRLEKAVKQKSLANDPFFEGWRLALLEPVRADIEETLKQ
ncbi:ribonuclease D [Marinobacter persicus]|uniref:Ribonuclease D n=2 Tax=Marinobacter persicus TaxID=930118 RepID=A0A1I3TTS2_9GAMM|nr:HRDC domain-containing protein [Marinobacter persicus]GHD45823.1 ribonuclease D [Marinobacter persicus]SFJ74010.1 ribonuclease D [Marinobacter persicus]